MRLSAIVGFGLLQQVDGALWQTAVQANEWDQLDASTGQVVASKEVHSGAATAQTKADVDRVAGVYYTLRLKEGFVAHIELHGFDVASGKVVSEVKLPMLERFSGSWAEGVWGVAVDDSPQQGGAAAHVPRVLVVGPTGKKQMDPAHAVLAVYPLNGTVDTLATTDMRPITATATTFDASTRTFYTLYAKQGTIETSVRGFDGGTGAVVYDRDITEYAAVYSLDATGDGALFLLGLDFTDPPPPTEPEQFRNLLRLEPKTGALVCVANFTDYKQNLPATAIDRQAGTLACMLVPQADFSADLVTIDLANASVVTAPQLCPQYTTAPGTLGYV